MGLGELANRLRLIVEDVTKKTAKMDAGDVSAASPIAPKQNSAVSPDTINGDRMNNMISSEGRSLVMRRTASLAGRRRRRL